MNVAIDRAHLDPDSSPFAYRISLAVADFAGLFLQANRREHDPLLDGFAMSPDGGQHCV